MYSRRHRGFTLIEMVIAIVVVGVGLAGMLAAFSTTVKASADPMIHKQMLAIAEEMMEEILLKPYDPPPGASGTISGCNRAAADDVSDYAAYTSQPVCDIDGAAVAGLEAYAVTVTVDAAASLGALATDVKKVTVTVTITPSNETLSLTGWRTNYAL